MVFPFTSYRAAGSPHSCSRLGSWMSTKSLVARSALKSRRHVKTKAARGWHAEDRTTKNLRRTLSLRSIRNARAKGRPLLVDLRVLASAYPSEKVPMLVVDDIRTAKHHIS